MSSVYPTTAPTTPAGVDRLNARALDATVALLVGQINALIDCLGKIRQARGRLSPGSVKLRNLSDECKEMLKEISGMLAAIRLASVNYDARQAITVTPTTAEADGAVTFLKEQAPPTPDFAPVLPVDGDPGKIYEVIVRVRAVAQQSPFIYTDLHGYAPGFVPGLRLYQTDRPTFPSGAGVGTLDEAVFVNAGAV